MKKIYSFVIAAAMAVVVSFSTMASSPEFEAVLGLNFSTINRYGIGFRPGFHAGFRGTWEIPSVTQGFYVNAATLLSLKGFKTDSVGYYPFFLDVPVHAGYKYEVDERFSMFIDAGPYVGIGLFGKSNGHDVFSDEVGYKRLDMGLGGRGGVEFNKRVSISLGGDFGFIKVFKTSKAKPRNVTFSVGYKF